MPRRIPVKGDITEIGEVRTPPIARVPDPIRLFERRGARFRTLSGPDGIGPYLAFLGDIAEAQAQLAGELGEPTPLDDASVDRSLEYGMPPLDRIAYTPDEEFLSLSERLFGALEPVKKPAAAQAALTKVQQATGEEIAAIVADLMADSVPVERMAEYGYVAAALQLHFARMASLLGDKKLQPVGDGACPSCGGPPVSSLIVNWPHANGSRFCSCALCGTLWHHVRIKCAICSSTKGIRYQEIEDGPGSIKAETCDECGCYVKIFNQQHDVSLDAFADDVGSLGIDLLMKDTNFRRGAFNPFLLGY